MNIWRPFRIRLIMHLLSAVFLKSWCKEYLTFWTSCSDRRGCARIGTFLSSAVWLLSERRGQKGNCPKDPGKEHEKVRESQHGLLTKQEPREIHGQNAKCDDFFCPLQHFGCKIWQWRCVSFGTIDFSSSCNTRNAAERFSTSLWNSFLQFSFVQGDTVCIPVSHSKWQKRVSITISQGR